MVSLALYWVCIAIRTYFSRYAYSHICGSMASFHTSQSHDINYSLTSNVKQYVRKSSMDNMYLISGADPGEGHRGQMTPF